MSAAARITLGTLDPALEDWSEFDWCLAVEVNGKTVLVFDEPIDSAFNIHGLDDFLASVKEGLDTQNSDGQLRLRYSNGA